MVFEGHQAPATWNMHVYWLCNWAYRSFVFFPGCRKRDSAYEWPEDWRASNTNQLGCPKAGHIHPERWWANYNSGTLSWISFLALYFSIDWLRTIVWTTLSQKLDQIGIRASCAYRHAEIDSTRNNWIYWRCSFAFHGMVKLGIKLSICLISIELIAVWDACLSLHDIT